MKTKTRRILGLFLSMLLLVVPLLGCKEEKIQGNVNSDIAQNAQAAGGLTIHYLDVGQGNAILLQSEGQSMLIEWRSKEKFFFCGKLSGKTEY